jgi:uncharacterized membrane protein (Fun14 family)
VDKKRLYIHVDNNILMSTENFSSIAATIGGGFFAGILIGYALKKVIKLAAIIVGLFLAGLAYLQYQQMAIVNWHKLQNASEGAISALANATTQLSNNLKNGGADDHTTAIASANFGIPLTGSMAMGCAIGFMTG